MRQEVWVLGMLLSAGCGARHAPPEPLPATSIEVAVEQAMVVESELLLVGLTIGTTNPAGVIVDEVAASAALQGMDLGALGLVPMMEAHMPPWALMLMWRIPEEAEAHQDASSFITGTVTWHVEGGTKQYSGFELQLDIPATEVEVEAAPSGSAQDLFPEEVEESL